MFSGKPDLKTSSGIRTLKIGSCCQANFVVTGGTAYCHNDNLQCHQWLQSWLHDKSCFLVQAITYASLPVLTWCNDYNFTRFHFRSQRTSVQSYNPHCASSISLSWGARIPSNPGRKPSTKSSPAWTTSCPNSSSPPIGWSSLTTYETNNHGSQMLSTCYRQRHHHHHHPRRPCRAGVWWAQECMDPCLWIIGCKQLVFGVKRC